METVKCCDRNNGWIYYDNTEGVFKLLGYDDTNDDPDTGNHPVEYCPWCGILLDINLVEKYEECNDLNISNDDLIRAWNYGDNSYNKGKS